MTPDKNAHNITPNNTHKNRMITSFINRFALICLIASGAMLTACIGNESKESLYDFSSRTFVLPGNFSLQASTSGDGAPLSAVALRYLNSIGFNKFERQGTVFGTAIRGNFDGNDDRLGAEDGFLIIETKGENGDGGHVFAGRFETTNVGDELTEAPPVATFSGRAAVILVHSEGGGGLFNANTSLRSALTFDSLDLEVNFDDKTLIGTDNNSLGRLNVSGRFNKQTLSGTVVATFTSGDVFRAANRSDFTATLTGVIGEDGAVGVFNSHLARGRPSDYALGGGFVVKPPPATNP